MSEKRDLQKILIEREGEKRENVLRQLQNGRQLIKNRILSLSKLENFPDGAFDIFKSNHIWEKVLDYLNNPCDLKCASLTCQTFRDDLKERRNQILLSQSLKILWRNGHLHQKEYRRNRWVPAINYLGLRAVSKSWKEVVDKQFFENSFTDESWYIKFGSRDWSCKFSYTQTCFFKNEESVDRAWAVYSKSVKGGLMTFPMRKLTIYVENQDVEIQSRFQSKLIHFLDAFGDSFWQLCYHDFMRTTMSISYERLWNLVKRMPNLKALILNDLTKQSMDSTAEEVVNLQRTLEQFPFPVLDSLEYFYFREENELLIAQIYQNSKNLKTVSCSKSQSVNEEMASALERLSLEKYSEPLGSRDIRDRNISTSVVLSNRVNWNLNELYLNVPQHYAKASYLFPLLNRFGDTLQYLQLYNSIANDETNVDLDLPHLKGLSVFIIGRGTIGFDDFRSLKSLQTVTIVMYEARPEDKIALVQLPGITCKMEYANMWKIFPDLRNLNFFINGMRCVRRGSTLIESSVIINLGAFYLNERLAVKTRVAKLGGKNRFKSLETFCALLAAAVAIGIYFWFKRYKL